MANRKSKAGLFKPRCLDCHRRAGGFLKLAPKIEAELEALGLDPRDVVINARNTGVDPITAALRMVA